MTKEENEENQNKIHQANSIGFIYTKWTARGLGSYRVGPQ